jgi:hypothetical protein
VVTTCLAVVVSATILRSSSCPKPVKFSHISQQLAIDLPFHEYGAVHRVAVKFVLSTFGQCLGDK